MESTLSLTKQAHHERQELCTNRPQYRQGRKLTAIKVYSVMDESKYLLIHRVPAIAVTAELETLCQGYGSIEYLRNVPGYPTDKFCEVYQVKFHTIQSARFAKRKMDDKSFYGGILHVCYAPELETLDDTRCKLLYRRQEICHKLKPPPNLKRKHYEMQVPLQIADTPSPSSVIKEQTSDSLEICIKPKHFTSDESDTIVATKKSQQPIAHPPVKRIVYHKRQSPPQSAAESS
ncbi:RNA-binding protein 48-like [Daphnia carinata]|uniref:RNA-binding protein 48-like n=1 Tax=Daphnia carinata TaxID=120202 RepID=UPI00257DB759|nr:RNA-binding protein 48-like [Daphnia carinata]XP_059353144.1 RNA-binding protein 48-like [Daphnia carinata]